MKPGIRVLTIFCALMLAVPGFVRATQCSISIETNPQNVDIAGSSKIKVKLTKEGKPYPGVQIFLGLQDITGALKDQVLTTNSDGTATTEFFPDKTGSGYVIARTTVKTETGVESLEAMAPLMVKDYNTEPVSIVDSITPLPCRLGNPVTFKGHGLDSDGSIAKWSWTFGDGQTAEGSGDQAIATHLYEKSGQYDTFFTVTDNRGTPSQPVKSRITVIDNKLPVGIIEGTWPDKAFIGIETSFPVILSDPEGLLAWCRIDFGDGTGEKVAITTGASWSYVFKHRYLRPGTFSVSVTPADDQGDGLAFPDPSWPIVIEGEAKGSAKLTIEGAAGKTIRLIGPLPAWKLAYEVTLGTQTVDTGMTLVGGRYWLLSSDSSFGFTLPEEPIEIRAFEVTDISTSVWFPTIKLEPVMVSGKPFINVTITDQNGNPVKRRTVCQISADSGQVEDSLNFDGGSGQFWIKPSLAATNITVSARIGQVNARTEKILQFPKPQPDIKITPTAHDGKLEIQFAPNSPVTGELALSWTAKDRITGAKVPVERIIGTPTRAIYFNSSKTFILPIIPLTDDWGRYELSLDCQMPMSGIMVKDSCKFDPCIAKTTLSATWSYASDGSAVIEMQMTDPSANPMPNQLMKLDHRFGRAIGYIPETAIITGLPSSARTDQTGGCRVSLDIRRVIGNLEIESFDTQVSTICSGVSFSTTVKVPPPPASIPSIITAAFTSEGLATISILAFNANTERQSGLWINITYSARNTKPASALGFPPDSIRTSTGGSATFTVKQLEFAQTIIFHAVIDGLPVISTVTLPAR